MRVAFSQASGLIGRLAAGTGDCCLKARRIHLGLLYVAFLILIVATIPLAQLAGRQPPAFKQPTTLAIGLDPVKL